MQSSVLGRSAASKSDISQGVNLSIKTDGVKCSMLDITCLRACGFVCVCVSVCGGGGYAN
jgi:hypothetical protein